MTDSRHSPARRLSRRSLLAAAAATPLLAPAIEAQSPDYVAAVASSHRLATEAAIAVLAEGGTAADAAFVVGAMLSVVEPYFSHALGGGIWGLYFDNAAGEVTALDGVGPAGSLISLEAYEPRSQVRGMHQANVPGSWDGWMLWLDRYGRIALPRLLQPAIDLARDGFAASAELGIFIGFEEENVRNHAPTAALYILDGELVEAANTLYNPDLAATFEGLVEAYTGGAIGALNRGVGEASARSAGLQAARDHFYRGPIAEAIVADSDREDGWFTMDDFASFEAEIVPAISIPYGETSRVYQCPPNSQGATMLLALNILKGIDQGGLTPHHPDVVHTQIEAVKLAFGDRHAFLADPATTDIDLEWLLSDEHGAEQLARIDMDAAMKWPENAATTSAGGNTTTIQISDQYGNAASVTTSIGFQFRVVTGTGININERMKFYSLDPENPNVVAPGKRVRHTSCPYMVLRDGVPWVIGGNTGVDAQPQVQLQQMMAAIDFSETPQQAIDRARWVTTAMPNSVIPSAVRNTLQCENPFPESVIAELEERGHDVEVGTGIFGSGGMIKFSEDRTSAEVGVDKRFSTSWGDIVL
ncbi:MAG: gamma-glutamyltransferase [Thermomicrobiales bacterium]|nr:gamma-glutamyltransferase [Thermomicrobiales bacterium]